MKRPSANSGRGPIVADAIYPVETFTKRLGIGRHSMTALRRRGLPVRAIGQRLFVDGAEALMALRRLWSEADQRIDDPPRNTENSGNDATTVREPVRGGMV